MGVRVLPRGYLRKTYAACLQKKVSFPCPVLYIRNVWAGEPREQDDAVAVRCHCFSSLKAKKVYVVHLVVKKSGDVFSASCTCIEGKGDTCSHIAALMFYLEDFMRQASILHFVVYCLIP